MKIIKIIVETSKAKEAKLFEPSKLASINPDIGIIIQKPAAFHVIKDCATLAHEYLPIYLFEKFENPFKELKGKVKVEDLQELITDSKKNIFFDHLLIIILEKAKTHIGSNIKNDDSNIKATCYTIENGNPYGEYGLQDLDQNQVVFDNETISLEILSKAFEC